MKSLKGCLKKGLGVGIFPLVAVEKEIFSNELICLDGALDIDETSVIMIWHAQKWCSPALSDFLKTVETFMQKDKPPFVKDPGLKLRGPACS